jgi:hypothetical protein
VAGSARKPDPDGKLNADPDPHHHSPAKKFGQMLFHKLPTGNSAFCSGKIQVKDIPIHHRILDGCGSACRLSDRDVPVSRVIKAEELQPSSLRHLHSGQRNR